MRRIAIIGRPNVGKSTLFNRLIGKKLALVHDLPGVTRDRRKGTATLASVSFEIIDTPGLEDADADSLEGLMTEQSMLAMQEAEAVMFVIDAKEGVTAQDEHFAGLVRRTGLPVVLIANKAEAKGSESGVIDGWRLGFGEPVAISAEHGVGMADLYDGLAPYIEPREGDAEDDEAEIPDMQVAIVGRPNVGKSTLMNHLLGEDRVLTGPYAGMTRDSIMVETVLGGRPVKLVDTAGMRKKARVQESLEKLSVHDTLYSIQYAHVVILVIDATQPLEKQDNVLAGLIEREGRACVIAVNKWDEIKEDQKMLLEDIERRLEDVAPKMRGISVMPISALKGKGTDKMIDAAFKAYDVWNTRIPTGELNRWLDVTLAKHTPPMVSGRRIKIRYVTQVNNRPPSFALFVNRKGLPDSYVQYLRGSLRSTFKLPGVPLRLMLRTGKNPYDEKK